MHRPIDVLMVLLGLAMGLVVFGLAALLTREFKRTWSLFADPTAHPPIPPAASTAWAPTQPATIEHAPYGDGGLDDSYDGLPVTQRQLVPPRSSLPR